MPYVIAFPSLALISAHDLPGSSSIEPKGAAGIQQREVIQSGLRAKQLGAEPCSRSHRRCGESNATDGSAMTIECVRSRDKKPYLHNETKGGICVKLEFNLQKNISLLQDGRHFFVYSSNIAAVRSCEHTL